MSDTFKDELTKTVAKLIAEAKDEAFKQGFYTGQAMAKVELEECQANWKLFTAPTGGNDEDNR